jgi:hypothetical protein
MADPDAAAAGDVEASAELDESADFEQPQTSKLPKTAAAMAAATFDCMSAPFLFFTARRYPDFAGAAQGATPSAGKQTGVSRISTRFAQLRYAKRFENDGLVSGPGSVA